MSHPGCLRNNEISRLELVKAAYRNTENWMKFDRNEITGLTEEYGEQWVIYKIFVY